VSPGAVFYSRYAIHEILFIFFQVLFSYGFWLYWAAETGRARRRAWIFMVASFFAMILIKETVIIFIVSWALAWFATEISLRIKPAALKISATRIKSRDILHPSDDFSVSEAIAIVMIGALCTVIIYGGFFYNPHGLIDMITAFSSWAKTGTSLTGHEKPYQYWLTLIARYEWPCLVALLSSVPLAVVGSPRARMMSIFSVGILAAYSLIPYKTPWCILNMIWPVAFVFGAAIERVCAAVADSKLRSSSQWFIRVASAALVCFSAYSAWSLNFINSMNLQEPYVYVQTTAQYKIVTDLINHASDVQPELRNVKLLVLNHDTWPLPFTLGSYPNLQWGKGAIADPQGFDVILIDAGDRARIEALVTKDYWRLPFKIRDSYDDGFAYLEKTLYRDFVQQYVFSTHSEASVVEIKRAEKPQ
jgi:uncharacterized protein (TIGR03663 family)